MKTNFVSATNASSQTILYPSLSPKALINKTISFFSKKYNIDSIYLEDEFSGEKGTTFVHRDKKGIKHILVGIGNPKSPHQLAENMRAFIFKNKHKIPQNIGLSLESKHIDIHKKNAADLMAGIVLGQYNIAKYKSKNSNFKKVKKIEIISSNKNDKWLQNQIKKGLALGQTQVRVMDLVNRPNNFKTPDTFADWVLNSAKNYGYNATIHNLKSIKKMGLGGLIAVNKGSQHPAKFLLLEYSPKKANKSLPTIGLIGKGVTFDTGGISIKPSANLHIMKSDMGGAAAVMGAIELTAKLQLKVKIIAAIGVTDNAVSAQAYTPSDVITTFSGHTVEIIDTDAEGRLTLADSLAYVNKNYKPDYLLDLATLTGSIVSAFGHEYGGLFTSSNSLRKKLLQAGQKSGEKLWAMPMDASYDKYIQSDLADVKNYSGMPLAGAITAARFLNHFVDKHPQWAHLDIAGTAFSPNPYSKGQNATGYGVRLLINFLENLD